VEEEGLMLPPGARLIALHAPCRHCRADGKTVTRGYIAETKGRSIVHCETCNRALHVAANPDPIKPERKTHDKISPSQRARVLMRDRHCVFCGRGENLQVGRLLSMAVGIKAGLTEAQLDDDENLAAMCGECNLGMADLEMPLWIVVPILRARMKGK